MVREISGYLESKENEPVVSKEKEPVVSEENEPVVNEENEPVVSKDNIEDNVGIEHGCIDTPKVSIRKSNRKIKPPVRLNL